MTADPAGGKAVNIEELEALREKATQGEWRVVNELGSDALQNDTRRTICDNETYYPQAVDIDNMKYLAALHNAAPELIAKARRLEALEEAMLKLYGPEMYWPRELKERSK